MAPGPTALASPENLLEMSISGFTPDLLNRKGGAGDGEALPVF